MSRGMAGSNLRSPEVVQFVPCSCRKASTRRHASSLASACSAARFAFAIVACLLAALASWWRGSRYVEGEAPEVAGPASGSPRPEPVAHQELG